MSAKHTPHHETLGKFYWPSAEYSIPADNLCWHIPPAPDRDFRCVRPHGHPGKHQYEWSPTIKDHSHHHAPTNLCKNKQVYVRSDGGCLACDADQGEACRRPEGGAS